MGHEVAEDNQSPLLPTSSSSTDVSAVLVKRTGTLSTAVAHIITGVIGAGVLSLAWSIAQLGWIAGPICMLAFAGVTIVSTHLLCDCYMFPHPEYGPNRLKSYMDAVRFYLGEKQHKVCGVIAQESLYGNTLAYVITSASSIKCVACFCETFQMETKRCHCCNRHLHGVEWICALSLIFLGVVENKQQLAIAIAIAIALGLGIV